MELGFMLKPGPARNSAAVVGLVAAVVCAVACARQCCRTCRVLSHLPWRSRRLYIDDNDMGVALTRVGHGFDSSMLAPAENIADVHDSIALEASPVESPEDVNQTSNIIYSVLVARSYYYEVVKQTKVIPKRDVLVRFQEEAQLYAVRLRPNFVHYLAERTELQDNASLHICAHNPMVDPYLTELYQNFQKGVDRENLLMVIFPPLDRLNSCLESPLLGRARTSTCTQFVATLSDLEMLLLQMTAGFMRRLVFVFPIDEHTQRP